MGSGRMGGRPVGGVLACGGMIGRWLGRRFGVAALLALSGCFSGETTLGAVCNEDADCGADLRCSNEVCGRCGDGIAQRGELCLVSAAEYPSALAVSPGELRTGDLEGDGTPELLLRGADGAPELWGRAEDGWRVLRTLTVGGTRGALRLANLDEDGRLDVVVVDEEAPALYVGHGAGAEGDEGEWVLEAAVMRSSPPLDLAVADATWAGPAWVAWVDAEGLWQAVVDPQTGTLGEAVQVAPSRVQWVSDPAALDGDDALDVAVADVDGMRVEPWFGDGNGGLTMGETVALEGRPTEVVAADVDGDGDFDLLVPDEDGGVTVIVGDGEGGLAIAERVEGPGPARTVVVADLDRSTERDLVVLGGAEPGLWAFLARGSRHPDGIALPVTGAVGAVVAADFDRDGLTELLLGPAEGVAPLRVVEVEP